VTPHHFTLIDEDVGDYDTNYKMNPPLRSREDREAMLAGVADGTIDAIATDHSPHAVQEKEVEFDRAEFGILGLESALGLAILRLHRERGVSLARLVQMFSTNPARIVRLEGRGTLAVGSHADVTIFDPKRRWKLVAARANPSRKTHPSTAGL